MVSFTGALSFVAAPNQTPYVTTKGAALLFTRALSVDLAPDRIRVNCVCPCVVDTPMVSEFITPESRATLDAVHLGVLTAEQVAESAARGLTNDETVGTGACGH